MTIQELIDAHWGDTIVLQGETPEAYTIRREAERLRARVRTWRSAWLVATERGVLLVEADRVRRLRGSHG